MLRQRLCLRINSKIAVNSSSDLPIIPVPGFFASPGLASVIRLAMKKWIRNQEGVIPGFIKTGNKYIFLLNGNSMDDNCAFLRIERE